MQEKRLECQADKSKVMGLGEEEGLECENRADEMRLEQVSEFKYLVCVLNESSVNDVECRRKL